MGGLGSCQRWQRMVVYSKRSAQLSILNAAPVAEVAGVDITEFQCASPADGEPLNHRCRRGRCSGGRCTMASQRC